MPLIDRIFLDDVDDTISLGFWRSNALFRNITLFNFWFLSSSGDVQPPSVGICPAVTWPDLTQAAFADMYILVHQTTVRDCAWNNRVTSGQGNYFVVVHESGHGAFGLPDEYCCDGGYSEVLPVLYLSEADCQGDPANAGWRNCNSIPSSGGAVWWRSENTNDIMSVASNTVLEFGRADWVVMEPVLGQLGATVNTPTVFAPNAWP